MKYVIIAIIIGFLGLGIFSYINNKNNVPAPEAAPVAQSTDTAAPVTEATQATSTTTGDTATTPAPDTTKIIKTVKTKNGMTIETLKEGTGDAITNGKIASMKYTGMLMDGTVFDATDKHGGTPFEFTLGAGQVIKGWDQGVLGMKIGEQRKLTIPSDLAYGPSGIPGAIPGGATLIFTVELVSFK